MKRQDELTLAGWKNRGTFDEPKLSELARMYREIGFEVLLEPFDPVNDATRCSQCLQACPDSFKTIYTRAAENH